MKDLYLILYNSACCVGWAGVLGLSLFSLFTSEKASFTDKLADIYGYPEVSLLLTISQSAAILEIVHAMLKLVRSPVMVTFMQVMSRIVALVAVEKSIHAQSKLIKVTTRDLVVNDLFLITRFSSSMGCRYDDSLLVHGRSPSLCVLFGSHCHG